MSVYRIRSADKTFYGVVDNQTQQWAGYKRFENSIGLERTAPIQGNSTIDSVARNKRGLYNLQRGLTAGSGTDFTLPLMPVEFDAMLVGFYTSQTPRPERNEGIKLVTATGVTINGTDTVYNFSSLNECALFTYEFISPTSGQYRLITQNLTTEGRQVAVTANTPTTSGNIPVNCTRFAIDAATTGNTITLPASGNYHGQICEIQNFVASVHTIQTTNTNLTTARILNNGNIATFRYSKLANRWLVIN